MSARTAELGEQLAAASAEVARIREELRKSVVADRKAGERPTDIIAESGVSLGTVYGWWREAGLKVRPTRTDQES